MFTTYHFIWIGICLVVFSVAICWLKKYRPSLEQFLTFACVTAVLSELIKTMSMLQVVPSSDGSTMYLYMETGHLPFHLCSIQILFIFCARFIKEGNLKETLLAFMYPTCIAGAFLAILLPSIFTSSIEVSQAFTHPLSYQYFLYHTMLMLLGIYIPISKETRIRGRHFLSSLTILGVLGFLSFYLNSIFAVPTYVNGELVSVDYASNFFFTQKTPIGIALTEKWHWFLYWGIIVMIAVVLLGAFYLPYMIKERKEGDMIIR